MDWLLEFAKANGMEGAMFLAVCFAAKWVADNVVKPIVAAHIQFLKAYETHMVSTDDWLECHAKSLRQLAKSDGDSAHSLKIMAENFGQMRCRANPQS